jgi:hypothetical protein
MGVGRVWEHAVKDVAGHGRMNGCMPLMPNTFYTITHAIREGKIGEIDERHAKDVRLGN